MTCVDTSSIDMKEHGPAPTDVGRADRAGPQIGIGQVRHARLKPAVNRFAYRTWFLMLPMRSLRSQPCKGLVRNRRGLVSFYDADHGEGGVDALVWFDGLLHQAGIHDADGEVWLQTFPRVLGYVFKPVSFWFAHGADGTLKAVVAEVNNTFGERHCYVLKGPVAWGTERTADKVFHVSPFCTTRGRYRFRFMRTSSRSAHGAHFTARVDYDDEAGAVLQTSVSGSLHPFSPGLLRKTWLSMPVLTFGIMARIHWQALRLWLHKVPFFSKPPAPDQTVTVVETRSASSFQFSGSSHHDSHS